MRRQPSRHTGRDAGRARPMTNRRIIPRREKKSPWPDRIALAGVVGVWIAVSGLALYSAFG